MRLWTDARLATMDPARGGLGLVARGAVLAGDDERIAFAGPVADLPREAARVEAVPLGGRLVTPGLVDCHTHLVWGGDRADEFERRLAGEGYEAIARSGGGIASTVRATRAATEDALVAAALPRLDALIADGVTTVEVKSGYGLDAANEAKLLRAARRLGGLRDVGVVTTFLGAHAVPPEFAGRRADYVADVIGRQLPAVHAQGLADAVDAFCEGIAFTVEEVAALFDAARALGLPVKLHAEQLSNLGGAAMAAARGARSCDHLEHLDEAGAAAMAAHGTVAVLLPGAFHYLRETVRPPVGALRRHGVPIAVATDLNPGSSPVHSLRTAMTLACLSFGLTVEEAWLGATRHAAAALGLGAGVLAPGHACDLAVWDAERPVEVIYNMAKPMLFARVRGGRAPA